MDCVNIKDFIKGWFVGNFEPSLYKTNDVEVAYKEYCSEDREEDHYHKVATEITLIVEGVVKMNNRTYATGDIIILKPNESSDFEAMTDAKTVVIKIPGANNDKYKL